MRTNIVLNDELIREAMTISGSRSKRAVVEEALRTYVEVKTAERQRSSYRERVRGLETRLRGLRLRQSPRTVLRADRDRE